MGNHVQGWHSSSGCLGIDLINFSRAAMQSPIMLHAKFASWELIVGLFLHNTFSLVLTSYDHASLIDVIDTHLHDVTMTRVKSEIRALNSRPRTALTLHATDMHASAAQTRRRALSHQSDPSWSGLRDYITLLKIGCYVILLGHLGIPVIKTSKNKCLSAPCRQVQS